MGIVAGWVLRNWHGQSGGQREDSVSCPTVSSVAELAPFLQRLQWRPQLWRSLSQELQEQIRERRIDPQEAQVAVANGWMNSMIAVNQTSPIEARLVFAGMSTSR